MLHNRLSQQLGQLSTPPGARPSRPDFFRFLTVTPLFSFCLSPSLAPSLYVAVAPRSLHGSYTRLSFYCLFRFFVSPPRLFLSPLPSSSVFSVTFNSDPSVPRSSPCLATLSTFLFPPTSTPVSLSLFFCYIQAHHSLFLYLLSLLTLIFACPCLSPPHSFYRLSPFLLVFYVVLALLLLLFPLLPPLCALEFCSVSLARTRVRQGGGPRALATPVTRG